MHRLHEWSKLLPTWLNNFGCFLDNFSLENVLFVKRYFDYFMP